MTTIVAGGFAEDALGRWNFIQWPPQFQFQFQVPSSRAASLLHKQAMQCNGGSDSDKATSSRQGQDGVGSPWC